MLRGRFRTLCVTEVTDPNPPITQCLSPAWSGRPRMARMNRVQNSLWRRSSPALVFLRGALPGGPILRLSKLVLATCALGLAFAGLRMLDGEAQAGRFLPEIENPYCAVKTYALRGVAELASSMTDRRGRPVIVVNRRTLHDDPAYSKFLLAHECCHHSLGHVANFKKGLGHVGPQAFFYIAPELKRLELEADCCAVKIMRERGHADGIEAGREAMSKFGTKPTGAHYPTGVERVETIMGCAAEL